jgi:hypothetical protein
MLTAVLILNLAVAGTAVSAPLSGEGPARSADAELARMGREIPGFGGLFYDAQGRPNVYLLDPDGAGGAALKSLGPEVQVRRGDYEFERLLGWRQELRSLLALPGVVFLDVDEARNRVVVGLDSTFRSKGLDRDRLEERLSAASIPRQAVVLAETGPIAPLTGLEEKRARPAPTSGLQSKIRPVPGGIQIAFSVFACTLGFNAYRGNVFGFVTNTHCTNVRGEVDGTRYYQERPTSGAIATEIADPPYFTDPPCPPGRRCRFSDSAFAKYDNPRLGSLGKIAKPVSGEPSAGTLVLNPATSRFTVKGRAGARFAGDVVYKVGRTTGWTYGPVDRTCVDVAVAGTDVILFCQSLVTAGVGGGDSGSPVFTWSGLTDVNLVGILWGGGTSGGQTVFAFSPLEAIEEELGPLRLN